MHIYVCPRLKRAIEEVDTLRPFPSDICHVAGEEGVYFKKILLSTLNRTSSIAYLHDMYKYCLAGKTPCKLL
jgi:hypothetical protein